MTTTDLYRVILKTLGVYFLIDYVVWNFTFTFYGNFSEGDIGLIMTSIVSFGVIVLVIYNLIFKTDGIINLLKLNSGKDSETIHFGNLTGTDLFRVAIVVIGISLVANNIIELVTNLYHYIETNIPNKIPVMDSRSHWSNLTYSGISVLFGLFITLNASNLALWLNKKTNRQEL